jgi:hypothetical protein
LVKTAGSRATRFTNMPLADSRTGATRGAPANGGGRCWVAGRGHAPPEGGCGRWPAGALPRWLPFLVKQVLKQATTCFRTAMRVLRCVCVFFIDELRRAAARGAPTEVGLDRGGVYSNLYGQTQNFNGGRRPLLLQLRPRPAAGASVCLSTKPLPAGLLPTWQGGGARGQSLPRAARAARTAVSENVTGPAPRSAHSVRGFAGELLGAIKRI